jgi:hypothetical protein
MAVSGCKCGDEKKFFGKAFWQCPSCRRVYCHDCIKSGFFSGKCPDCGEKTKPSDKI